MSWKLFEINHSDVSSVQMVQKSCNQRFATKPLVALHGCFPPLWPSTNERIFTRRLPSALCFCLTHARLGFWDDSTVYSLQSTVYSLSVSQSTVSLLWKEITVLRLQIERACKRSFLIYIACLCEQKSKAGQRNVQNSFTNTGYHIPQFQQKYVPSSKYSCSVG